MTGGLQEPYVTVGDLPGRLAIYRPALDWGWRVSVFPPGTDFTDALAAVTTAQATLGRTVDPASARLVPRFFLPTTADVLPDYERHSTDRGWRDMPANFGSVCLRYRVSGPGVHTP